MTKQELKSNNQICDLEIGPLNLFGACPPLSMDARLPFVGQGSVLRRISWNFFHAYANFLI